MQSLVLERKSELAIREVDVCDELGPHDCRVKIHSVGICGSDVHYYEHAAPGATCVLVGMPIEPVPFDVVMAQAKEITFQTVFRYRNVYPRIIRLLSFGKMDVKPLISATFAFKDSVKAYERAMNRDPKDMKIMIPVYGDKTNMLKVVPYDDDDRCTHTRTHTHTVSGVAALEEA
ncbi:hypothetical_protein [Leishmania braziliensis MHOM/BR/75/M2904]|uniref:Hypothetical_protein n=1 Tax=Leishmania braziliensis MHOM/BR/75/M2904 TaxID=420245 RepID=A0A3P3ZFD9_LEIBR|nr:hypothetical_protein [Leishmania braziliensis MHOM/BR/75/M2904]